jgi:2-polyprenyl-3-methyl-5-hydroxy-6-metoxy-1,4-benzoquinol methylase
MKQWYEKLFENYGEKYDNEVFTQGTLGECNFIELELQHVRALKVLDVGCGTGRHSIELARRGFEMTGIDLSASMLKKATEKAHSETLNIRFLQHDARDLPFESEFDAAIMMCEGGFPLMETDEMNFAILQSVAKALKPGGKFIFTTLNGLFPLFHSINDFHGSVEDRDDGATYESNTFDLMSFRDYNLTTYTDDAGVEHQIECSERYYAPSEISWLLKSLGFKSIEIFGATLGAFSRSDTLKTSDYEMLVVAVKGE